MKNKKKFLSLFLLSFVFVGCKNYKAPTKLTISGDISVAINSSIDFTASFEPSDATKDVVWSVDNDDMASIDEKGKLTAKSYIGIVEVKAVSKLNNEVFATQSVYISKSKEKADFFTEYYKRNLKAMSLGLNYYKNVTLDDGDIFNGKSYKEYLGVKLEYDDTFFCSVMFVESEGGSSKGFIVVNDVYQIHLTSLFVEEFYNVKYSFREDKSIQMEFLNKENNEVIFRDVYNEEGYLIENYSIDLDTNKVENNVHFHYVKS